MIRSAAVSQSATAVVLAVGGLYVAQSVIGGLTWAGLPAVLRDRGLGLDSVGLLSLIALPWALKFLWAPMVERFRLPPVGRNRSGVIVIFGGGLSIVGLGVVGLLGVASLGPVLACLTIIALAAATVDIACDGYAVESLPREQHGWANAAQVGGAYLGSAIGGGLFLVLVASYGWSLGVWAIAALLAILGVPFFLRWRTEATVERRSHIPSLASALRRPEIRRGLLAGQVVDLLLQAHTRRAQSLRMFRQGGVLAAKVFGLDAGLPQQEAAALAQGARLGGDADVAADQPAPEADAAAQCARVGRQQHGAQVAQRGLQIARAGLRQRADRGSVLGQAGSVGVRSGKPAHLGGSPSRS